jgi:hypothetical protein
MASRIGKHGTRQGYQQGCRCAECRRANTDYTRRYRVARLTGEPLSRPNLVALPTVQQPQPDPPPREPGEIEAAVLLQCANYDLARRARHGRAGASDGANFGR